MKARTAWSRQTVTICLDHYNRPPEWVPALGEVIDTRGHDCRPGCIGRSKEMEIHDLEVCADCVQGIEYGRTDHEWRGILPEWDGFVIVNGRPGDSGDVEDRDEFRARHTCDCCGDTYSGSVYFASAWKR